MFENVSILIPYKSDNGPRESAFHWVKKYYQTVLPKAELCIGDSPGNPFNRSQAINNAAKLATRPIFIIADCDLVYSPSILENSIKFIDQYTWIIPFQQILNLSSKNTERLLMSESNWPFHVTINDYHIDNSYPAVGGLNVLRRKDFIKVGGFDERFVGWGGEDDAFAYAMNTLCGPFIRLDEDIYHLWHPRVGAEGNPNYQANYDLYTRYQQAETDVAAMQRLVKRN